MDSAVLPSELVNIMWPIFIGIFLFLDVTQAANILAMVPLKGRSHFIVMQPFLEGLAEKGHNVTVVSVFPRKIPLNNYHDIDLSSGKEPELNRLTIEQIDSNLRSPLQGMHFVWDLSVEMCQFVYNSSEFLNLMEKHQEYDLIITEIFGTDCFTPLAYKWKVPLVSLSTFYPVPWLGPRVSNPENPSYMANYNLPLTEKMSLHERVLNTLTFIYARLGYQYFSDLPSHNIANTYFGGGLPPLAEIYGNTSLILVNTHHSISQVRPIVPNIVEIGGIHLKAPNPLPEDLQRFLDESNRGVIVFSFGSIVRTSSLPPAVIKGFIDAFSRIEQSVLWKYEEKIHNLPKNVITRKWIPQMDVMAHPNVKLLITHGGLASTIEAAFYGVPIIGIPMFGDQPGNVQNFVKRGAGLHIECSDINAEKVYNTIQRILLNPEFKANCEELSRIFKDREQPPLETAIYWTEYVLRHGGAAHLKSSAYHLSWLQKQCLDVLTFLAIVISIIFLAMFKLISAFVKISIAKLQLITNK